MFDPSSKAKYKGKPNPKKEGMHVIWFSMFVAVFVIGLMYVFQPYQPSAPTVRAAEEEGVW